MKLTRRRVIIGVIVLVVCAALFSRSPQQERGTATAVVVTQAATSTSTPRATATSTATATLAPSPVEAPTLMRPSPSPAPATVPTAPAITIELIRLTSPIARGSDAVLQIRTAPGARCSLSYVTPSGNASEAQGLGPMVADGNGVCAWVWRISGNTALGMGRLRVSVDGVGQGYEIEVQ